MTAREIVASLKSLQPVSRAGLKLMKVLGRHDQDNDTVIECLKYDNVLTARVLRTCNSSFYGYGQRVTSVDEAVLLIGHEQIMRMVLTLSLGGPMGAPMDAYAFDANELWRHSLSTAFVAECLAKDGLVAGAEASAAFTAGLLHDIGKVAFNQVLSPELLAKLRYQIAEHGMSRVEAERDVIGTDHAEVGGELLSKWELPPLIVEAVARHHQPEITPLRLSAVTCVADTIVHLAGSAPGWESYALKIDPALVEPLHLTAEKIEIMLIDARESFDRVAQFMEVA